MCDVEDGKNSESAKSVSNRWVLWACLIESFACDNRATWEFVPDDRTGCCHDNVLVSDLPSVILIQSRQWDLFSTFISRHVVTVNDVAHILRNAIIQDFVFRSSYKSTML